jgi:hypothetical protein
MNNEKSLTIHFTCGTKLEFSFPTQVNSTAAVIEAMKKNIECDKFVIEADGRMLVIPWTSIKQLEVTPVPGALPFFAIKGAKLLDSGAGVPSAI